MDATFRCRVCHQRKTAHRFPNQGVRTIEPVEHAIAVLGQGAWRRCILCELKRPGGSNTSAAAPSSFSTQCKQVIVCNSCKVSKAQRNFDFADVHDLNARGQLDLAVCVACTPERQRFNVQSGTRLLECALCKEHSFGRHHLQSVARAAAI